MGKALALLMVKPRPDDRPDISDVLNKLDTLRRTTDYKNGRNTDTFDWFCKYHRN
eukprot:NODE_7209_length_287_cov_217.852941_g6049_i0.p2 GENE.NODE_7209_length_287_cov_217.852941_g6049_i0~~NODE_7209_length_287_cov_217.852941_g6049_i0.p2  ORF type:complete len:63 (+),score=26.74 NODE_7209_length_287_cov_217.852941_g6049_i0:26-190(+)